MKITATSFKRSHACAAALSAPKPAAGHHRPTPLPQTSGHSRASLGQSLGGSLLLPPESWCTHGFVCPLQESVYPVLCKFWKLYSGVNGDLFQEGLCHTQVCCIQTVSITCLLYGLIYINIYSGSSCSKNFLLSRRRIETLENTDMIQISGLFQSSMCSGF